MADKIRTNEKLTPSVTGQFVDENGNGLAGSVFDVLMLSIYHKSKPTLFIRSSDDVRSDPNFVIDEEGNFTWDIRAFETEILEPASVRIGSTEQHVAIFEFAWNSTSAGTHTNPFTTASGSKNVTVTIPGHALAVDDNIYFMPDSDAGGLDLGGHYIVRSVVDANRFTVEHFSNATASVNGSGGDVEWFANGRAASHEILMQIKRVDPV